MPATPWPMPRNSPPRGCSPRGPASVTRRFWDMRTHVASAAIGPSNLLESLQRRLLKPLLKPGIGEARRSSDNHARWISYLYNADCRQSAPMLVECDGFRIAKPDPKTKRGGPSDRRVARPDSERRCPARIAADRDRDVAAVESLP